MANKSGIHIKEKNEGKFTAWVHANMPGVSVSAAASRIMAAPKGKYTPHVREMANFAKNQKGWK
jgi:hypothetical protein